MKLSVNFSGLENAVRTMGASKRTDFKLDLELTGIDPIDVGLEKGIAVELKDVVVNSGLLSYQGRQILVYIEDHGSRVNSVISSGSSGNKYHVADCGKLQGMRLEGRYDRYVVTNNTSGKFQVSGFNYNDRSKVEGLAKLNICKLCLSKLNYKNYSDSSQRTYVFYHFSMAEFFSTYGSYFPHVPKAKAGERDVGYSDDWVALSAKYKYSQDYCCESCDLKLKDHKHLLHSHHINGVKSDNQFSNLKALCADCHGKQVHHEHMHVRHNDRKLITRLRQEQSKADIDDWKDIFSLSDPAMHGFLYACQNKNTPLPEVGYMLLDQNEMPIAELEIAWPDANVGFVIGEEDKFQATECGWDIRTAQDGLESIASFSTYLQRVCR
jgi:hypothetical protein